MKVRSSQLSRRAWRPTVGLLALGALVVGCGDKESNPDAVSVEDLKSPTGLTLFDEGNGNATLKWSGANNEDDFDGYNVYGAKSTAAIAAKKNGVVELVDADGNPVAGAKDYLQNFAYNGTDFESAGTKTDPDAEFEFLPIHAAGADGAPLLPTCKPAAAGTCDATTAASKDAKAVLNGRTAYSVKGMKPGSEYCFLVLSSIDGGTSVSSTTSEVRCMKPKYKTTMTLKVDNTGGVNDRVGINLGKILEGCNGGTCPAPNSTPADGTVLVRAANQAGAATTEALNFEAFNGDSTAIYLTGGKNTAIKLVGYKAGGFTDPSIPSEISALSKWSADLENEGGYSITGASVPVFAKYVYVVAVGTADNPTTFNYYWLWVDAEQSGIGAGKDVKVHVMLPKDVGDLSLGDLEK